ncbi:MAG TPA: SPOR domain-containing protein [Gemmatimonadaceae bacterium]|nr:SPOR domain-containing protein [Gemmatimonadaceae bacterium]
MTRAARILTFGAAIALGCGSDEARQRVREAEKAAGADSAAVVADTVRKTFGTVIQLASFAEEERAKALRDELEEEGWRPWITRATVQGDARWRVNVAPLYDGFKLGLARATANVLNAHGRDALLAEDSIPALARTDSVDVFEGWISTTPVSQRQPFMIGQARWLLSPDSTAMIAMQHNTAIENEPLPNEFIYASNRDGQWGPFRSWDVTPSPDWRWLAWGKPFLMNPPREQDSVSLAQWEPVAHVAGLAPEEVAAASFAASAMGYQRGFSQPIVVPLRPPAFRDEGERDPNGISASGGWRVRWTLDGRLAAFGSNPERAQSDAPSKRWLLIDPTAREARDSIDDITRLARVPWNVGPTFDSGTPIDFNATRRFRVGALTVESRDGFVRVYGSADGRRLTRIVGPGMALGATRGARYIAAVIPRPDAAAGETSARYVVYQVNR